MRYYDVITGPANCEGLRVGWGREEGEEHREFGEIGLVRPRAGKGDWRTAISLTLRRLSCKKNRYRTRTESTLCRSTACRLFVRRVNFDPPPLQRWGNNSVVCAYTYFVDCL